MTLGANSQPGPGPLIRLHVNLWLQALSGHPVHTLAFGCPHWGDVADHQPYDQILYARYPWDPDEEHQVPGPRNQPSHWVLARGAARIQK